MGELETLIAEQRRDDTTIQYPEFRGTVSLSAFENEVIDADGHMTVRLPDPRPRTTSRPRPTPDRRRAQYRESKRARYHADPTIRQRVLARMRARRERSKR